MSKLTLFDLTAHITEIIDDIVVAYEIGNPELADELFDELAQLHLQRNDKLEGYVHVIKNSQIAADAAKAEAAAFAKRARALEALATRLKKTLLEDLVHHDEKSSNAGRFKIARQAGAPRVAVTIPAGDLPEEYQRVTVDADKTALKTALKQGEQIEGVTLELTEHLRIRAK